MLSALGMGLAWLTKLPGIYLVPFVTLLTFIELGRQWWQKREPTRRDLASLMALDGFGGHEYRVFCAFLASDVGRANH